MVQAQGIRRTAEVPRGWGRASRAEMSPFWSTHAGVIVFLDDS
jgi:hypothetical protein